MTGAEIECTERMYLKELPNREKLEWYISSHNGGKDGKGVAVIYNRETGLLETGPSFQKRADDWRRGDYLDDPYRLAELPTLEQLNDYLNGSAHYNGEKHVIESKRKLN